MDAVDGRDVDVGHALASREAFDELHYGLIQGVEPGRSDRFDQAVAFAAVTETMRDCRVSLRVEASEKGQFGSSRSRLVPSREVSDSRSEVEREVMGDDQRQRERRFGRVIGKDRLMVMWEKGCTKGKTKPSAEQKRAVTAVLPIAPRRTH